MDEWIRSTFKLGSLQANAGWETRDCRPRHLRQHTCTRTLAPFAPFAPRHTLALDGRKLGPVKPSASRAGGGG